jgi:hypothetical protein
LLVTISLRLGGTEPEWRVVDEGSFRLTIPGEWKKLESQGIDSHVGRYDGPGAILMFDEVFGLGVTVKETSDAVERLKAKKANPNLLQPGEEVWVIHGRLATFYLSELELRLREQWPFKNVAELKVPYHRKAGYLSVTVIYRSVEELAVVRRVLGSILWKKGPPSEERRVGVWGRFIAELKFTSTLPVTLFVLLTILVAYKFATRGKKSEAT